MIKELYCKNFKVFREATAVPLAPLTVVTGPNNSGKSSIVDLIRLMTQEPTADDTTRPLYSLNLHNGDHRIRTFPELLHDPNAPLHVGYCVTPHSWRDWIRDINFETEKMSFRFALVDDIYTTATFDAVGANPYLKQKDIALAERGDTSNKTPLFTELHELGDVRRRRDAEQERKEKRRKQAEASDSEAGQAFLDAIEASMASQEPPKAGRRIGFGAPRTGKSTIRGTDNIAGDGRWDQRERLHREERNKYLPHVNTGRYERERSVTWTLHRSFCEMARDLLREFYDRKGHAFPDFEVEETKFALWLGPLDKMLFTEDQVPPHPGPFGPNVLKGTLLEDQLPPSWVTEPFADAWEQMLRRVIAPLVEELEQECSRAPLHVPAFRARPKRYYGPQDALTQLLRDYRDVGGARREEVNRWLDTFKIGSDLQVEKIGPDLFEAHVQRGGRRRYLADLGSGSAQLLPLILNLASIRHSFVLVEEPEANLHPNLQARLADFFVELMNRGIQVVVETHSEYLTRRLQYLVARDTCNSEHVGILYLRDK